MGEPEHIGVILKRVFDELEKQYRKNLGAQSTDSCGSQVAMENLMECPYCKCQEVHLQAVEVNRGGEITSIDQDGTKLKAGEPSGRGVRVEMILWCEAGHKWRHSLQFNKGALLIEDNLLLNGCPNCCQGHELWRD